MKFCVKTEICCCFCCRGSCDDIDWWAHLSSCPPKKPSGEVTFYARAQKMFIFFQLLYTVSRTAFLYRLWSVNLSVINTVFHNINMRNACVNKTQYMCKRLQFVSKWELNTRSASEKWFSLGLDALILPHREFELCVRTEESWPLSWTAKSRWAVRSLKMCFACLVTLKAISCHSYSVHWQRRIAPWQIVLATGPYMHWTLKLARVCLSWGSVHESSI